MGHSADHATRQAQFLQLAISKSVKLADDLIELAAAGQAVLCRNEQSGDCAKAAVCDFCCVCHLSRALKAVIVAMSLRWGKCCVCTTSGSALLLCRKRMRKVISSWGLRVVLQTLFAQELIELNSFAE